MSVRKDCRPPRLVSSAIQLMRHVGKRTASPNEPTEKTMNSLECPHQGRGDRPSPPRPLHAAAGFRRLLLPAAVIVVWSGSACSPSGSSPPEATGSTGWNIYATPVLKRSTFYDETGVAATFFRISDLALHGDRVGVADEGDGSIRVFDDNGQEVLSMGEEGDGPGEFQALRRLWAYSGDSLLSFDAVQDRATIWSPAGIPCRTVSIADDWEGSRYFSLHGPLSDGGLVWSGSYYKPTAADRQPVQETVLITSDVGEIERTIGPFEGEERSGRRSQFDLGEVPFTSEMLVATRGGEILVANTKEMGVSVYARSGREVSRLGLKVQPERITEEWQQLDARLRKAWYQNGPRSPLREDRVNGIAFLEYPSAFPVASAMQASPEGEVWVAEYSLPDGSTPYPSFSSPATVSNTWHVFASSGEHLGLVHFPKGLLLLDVADGRAAGMWRDSLGVENVRIYDIVQGPKSKR